MHVCVSVCVHACEYVWAKVCRCVCVSVYTHFRMCTCVYLCVYNNSHVCLHVHMCLYVIPDTVKLLRGKIFTVREENAYSQKNFCGSMLVDLSTRP